MNQKYETCDAASEETVDGPLRPSASTRPGVASNSREFGAAPQTSTSHPCHRYRLRTGGHPGASGVKGTRSLPIVSELRSGRGWCSAALRVSRVVPGSTNATGTTVTGGRRFSDTELGRCAPWPSRRASCSRFDVGGRWWVRVRDGVDWFTRESFRVSVRRIRPRTLGRMREHPRAPNGQSAVGSAGLADRGADLARSHVASVTCTVPPPYAASW